MRELLYQDKSVHHRLDFRQRRVYSVPRRSFWLPHIVLFFFRYCTAFEMMRTSFEIRITVLSTSRLGCVFAYAFFYSINNVECRNYLSEVDR